VKLLLVLSAILACLFGLMLIVIPDKMYEPAGIAMTPMMATLAQAHGATLIGLGVINWFARNADRQGLIAVCAGNLVVQVLSLLVVLRTMQLGAGSAVAPGIAIHVILGAFFGYFLAKLRRDFQGGLKSGT
jgi:hypothetical protein